MTRAARRRRGLVVAVFLSAYFLSYFYRSTNAVIADELSRDLALGAGALGLMTSLFFVAFAAVQLPLGSALDRFGARWVTSTLLLSAVAGSLLFGLATSAAGVLVGRALIGVGMAGVLMGALKAFAAWYEPRAFATVAGLFVGVGSLGALVAATPLALLADALGWRAVFVLGALVTLLVAVAVAVVVREPPGRAADVPTATAGAGGFAQVFASVRFWRLAGLTFSLAGTLFAFQGLWAGPFLMHRIGLGTVATGNVLLVMGLAATAGFLLAGPLASRIGAARVGGGGGVLLVVSLAALALAHPSWPTAVVATAFAALALAGSCNVLVFALARADFPAMPGRAVTAVNLFGIGGGAALQWGLGVVIGAFAPAADGRPPDVAYTAAVLVSLAVATLALVAFLPLMRPPPAERDATGAEETVHG